MTTLQQGAIEGLELALTHDRFPFINNIISNNFSSRKSILYERQFHGCRGPMTSLDDNSVQCQFLLEPTEDQIRQIVELYRAQGWWLACDEAEKKVDSPVLSRVAIVLSLPRTAEGIVGMGRAISDGISDAYIQDLTVRHDCRNRGIAENDSYSAAGTPPCRWHRLDRPDRRTRFKKSLSRAGFQ